MNGDISDLLKIIITVIIAILGWLYIKYSNRQEEDLKSLSEKHETIYEALIETQQRNTESSNRLASSIDKLTITVVNIESQSAERHASLTARINDNHEAIELIRLRLHWVINKMTVLKMHLEKDGTRLTGNWETP